MNISASPQDHPASLRFFLKERIADVIHPGNVHYIMGDTQEPVRECEQYEQLLRADVIDLCCLGIGENGHLAFNDPPVANFTDPRWVKLAKLDKASRRQQVGEGFYPSLDYVPEYAFTLTIPALCSAKQMICIVPELRKAQAVQQALIGPIDTSCPASWLRLQNHAHLYLDADSASLL